MDAEKFECGALAERDGIYLEHIGCSQSARIIYHDFVMVAYIAYASGFHELNGKTEPVSEGDIVIIKPGNRHRFYASDNVKWMELYYCYFLPQRFRELWLELKEDFPEYEDFFSNSGTAFLRIRDNSNKEFRNLFVRMIDEFMHTPEGYRYTLQSYFTIFMTKFMRTHKSALNNPVFNQNNLIDEIIRYINYHMYSGISVKKIAEAHHISEEYLCRLFKKHTGKTIIQFINDIKVDKIKDILKNTDRPIESISAAMNCSTVYLKRLFKKSTGMSLGEYRKKYNFKRGAAE
ncbi:MAG: AraC family transcriptional regulator [Candidatus Ornithomonoglobus sp.]